jgi:hypothetical protein
MANSNLTETKPSIPPKSPKKKYSPPKLTEYGTIKEMTGVVGNKQALDNPTSGTKTGFV